MPQNVIVRLHNQDGTPAASRIVPINDLRYAGVVLFGDHFYLFSGLDGTYNGMPIVKFIRTGSPVDVYDYPVS